nr:hypothetical protein BaRGS_004609 [Batillaria attramentaria]
MTLLDCLNDTNSSSHGNGSGAGVDEEVDVYIKMVAEEVKHYIMDHGIPVVSGLGLLGNFLALVVLTKEKLHKTLSKMEISAHIGLIALAVSDLLFCMLVLFVTVLPLKEAYEAGEVLVYYHLISGGLITVFIITSTWLIVVMAAERYVAVCHPLKARNLISLTRTRAYVITLFVLCPLCTIPVFLERRIQSVECWDGRLVYRVVEADPENVAVRRIVWALFFDFVPCFALIYFNTCLIWKIRKAKQLRDKMAPHQSSSACMHSNSTSVRRFRWDRSNTNSPDRGGLRGSDSNKALVGSSRHQNGLESSSHDHSHSGVNSVELHPREMQLCKQNGTTLVKNSPRAPFNISTPRRSPGSQRGQTRQQRVISGKRRFSDNALNRQVVV